MGIQAFKAVEIGLGTECSTRFGSEVHDPIHFDGASRDQSHFGFSRPTNSAGGIEGGMSNGMPVVVKGTMKPISLANRSGVTTNGRTCAPCQQQVLSWKTSLVSKLPPLFLNRSVVQPWKLFEQPTMHLLMLQERSFRHEFDYCLGTWGSANSIKRGGHV